MAPSKRAAPDSASTSKRAKGSAGGKRRTAISDALSEASSIQVATREMLCAVIPGALGVPHGERNEIQQSMVRVLEQALDGHLVALQTNVDGATTNVDVIAEETSSSAAKTEELSAALAAKTEEVTGKAATLDEDEAAVEKCTKELEAEKCAEAGLAAELKVVTEQRNSLQKVATEVFATLEAASEKTHKATAKKHIALLLKTLEDVVDLEESLTLGIPVAMCKPVAERGPYDIMIFNYVSKVFEEETSKRTARLDGGAQEALEKAGAVQAAQETLEAASAARAVSTEELATARQEKVDLGTQLAASKAEDKKLIAKVAKAAGEKTASDDCLAAFKEVLALFATERDGEPIHDSPPAKHVLPELEPAPIATAGA